MLTMKSKNLDPVMIDGAQYEVGAILGRDIIDGGFMEKLEEEHRKSVEAAEGDITKLADAVIRHHNAIIAHYVPNLDPLDLNPSCRNRLYRYIVSSGEDMSEEENGKEKNVPVPAAPMRTESLPDQEKAMRRAAEAQVAK